MSEIELASNDLQPVKLMICLRTQNGTVKFAWFNEDRQGVYGGFYGDAKGFHLSYHQDGVTHFRAGDRTDPIATIEPINSIKEYRQVGAAGIAISQLERYGDGLKGSERRPAIFLSLPDRSDEITHVFVSHFILRSPAIPSFTDAFLRLLSSQSDTAVLAFVTFPLQYFPDHELGVLMTTGNHPVNGSRVQRRNCTEYGSSKSRP